MKMPRHYQIIQNTKTENYTCIQTSFSNVNTNNASLGLRENVILINLVTIFGRKNIAPTCMMGGGREMGDTLGRDIHAPSNFAPLFSQT